MIYIKKQKTPPQAFIDAIGELKSYSDLKGAARETVEGLLLEEQGGLCAICERLHKRFAPTIEHFMPQSVFPALQLDYHNLYIACSPCNEPKAHHLIPSYIFDPRFDPFYDLKNSVIPKEFKLSYHLYDENKCSVTVQAASQSIKKLKSEHHSAYILQSTLDLLQQNRDNEPNSLLRLRSDVYNLYMKRLPMLTAQELTHKFINMRNAAQYPEFISLITQLYAHEFRRRKMETP
jgi:hypothetical protein